MQVEKQYYEMVLKYGKFLSTFCFVSAVMLPVFISCCCNSSSGIIMVLLKITTFTHSNAFMKKPAQKSIQFTVREADTLLPFLMKVFPGKSRTSLKQLMQNGAILVDGAVATRHDFVLNQGQIVSLGAVATKPSISIPGIKILYEDDSLIAIDKPSGLLTVGTEKEKTNTAYSLLSHYVKTENKNNKIFIVHRLDRDTSGVLVFARNTNVRDVLQEYWHNENHKREYAALVCGKTEEPQGRIESWLKENANLQVFSSLRPDDGQHAITNWELVQQNDEYSLLKVIPETGRRNQIRVHMCDIGFPIVGDRRYGNGQNPIGRLGLHATLLSFIHPENGKVMTFESSVPGSFLRMVKK
jgi:23S rRNA pseudouridine1911/1915/1917 synthase